MEHGIYYASIGHFAVSIGYGLFVHRSICVAPFEARAARMRVRMDDDSRWYQLFTFFFIFIIIILFRKGKP